MIIRKVNEEDSRIGDFINEEFSAYGEQNEVALNYEDYCFVAEDDNGNIMGVITGRAYYNEVHIGDLIVGQNYRRSGLGRKLVEAVEETYKGKLYEKITLTTFGFQAPEFYKKLGYEVEFVREDKNPKLSKYFLMKHIDSFAYLDYAKQCSSNRVYPLSIVEGLQEGEIIPDDEKDIKAVLFWHYSGFAYLSGDVEDSFLQKIYEDYYLKESDRRFILITDDPKVIQFFSDKDGLVLDKRIEYGFGSVQKNEFKCDYRIERIDESNYDRIHGRIVPSFSWSGKEQFLKNGFGYVALDGEKVIAIAFSAAVSSEEVDIGVETDEHYQHKGLAKTLADRMCREVLSIGKKPVWAHAVSNEGSKHTALAVGFVEDRINTVIRKM